MVIVLVSAIIITIIVLINIIIIIMTFTLMTEYWASMGSLGSEG